MIQQPKHKLVLEVPGGAAKVLLHTCCAPCSSAIIECMLQQGITPVIYYSNSNIFPLDEYLHRKDECTRYAQSLGLEIVDDDYAHDRWRCEVAKGRENEPERGARCLECFKYRLLRAARYASENGFTVLTTTLASSRWKDLDQVNAAGLWACDTVNQAMASGRDFCGSLSPVSCQNHSEKAAGVARGFTASILMPATRAAGLQPAGCRGQSPLKWWSQNWRKGGLQDRRNQIIKEMNFYNQLYCGCEYSMRTVSPDA